MHWRRRRRPAGGGGAGGAGGAGAAGGERSGGTGSEGEAGSGCGGVARHRKKAFRHCKVDEHGRVSLGEGKQRKMNAGKTSVDCSGGGWVESPGVHTPSPSTNKEHNCYSWIHSTCPSSTDQYRVLESLPTSQKYNLGRTLWALLSIYSLHSHENSKACGSFCQQVHKWLLNLQKAFDCVEPWGILLGVL